MILWGRKADAAARGPGGAANSPLCFPTKNGAAAGAPEIRLADYTPYPAVLRSVGLEFDLWEEHAVVRSALCFEGKADFDGSLFLEGEELELVRIALRDGGPLEEGRGFERRPGGLQLSGLPVTGTFVVEVEVRIRPQDNTRLEGLYKSSGNFCTQCEAEGFRYITYFPDRPDVMSVYTVKVTAAKELYPVLLSNGNLVASEDVETGRHSTTWSDPHPKPCYLFALVAGRLELREGIFTTMSGRQVQLRMWAEAHNVSKTGYALESLKAAMRWDEERFGREYDLDQFNIVAVDDFNMGAMENKSLNVFNSRLVLASPETATDFDYTRIEGVIGHEYFHNWSGNRVTCRDWFQLSLKEGLTVFRDQEFTGHMNSAPVKRIEDVATLRSRQFAEDAGPMSHPVRPASYQKIDNFYTLTVYEKGAEVIRMYQTLLSREGFRKGTDLYFERHDGQAVTCDHFYKAMEDANGADLGNFKLWYSQAGTPVLKVRASFDADRKEYSLTCKQELPSTPGSPSSEKQPQLIPIKLGLLCPDGSGEFAPATVSVDGGAPAPVVTSNGNCILRLTEQEQTFTFQDIDAEPVPSLLREFSAPVKLEIEQSRADLLFLLAHDTDPFNRWEAMQRLMNGVIVDLYPAALQGHDLVGLDPSIAAALQEVLTSPGLDQAFVALTLRLPALNELLESPEGGNVDPVAMYTARKHVATEVARQLRDTFLSIYRENCREGIKYVPSTAEKARRALKNSALSYLALLKEDSEVQDIVAKAYSGANNMTDQIAALAAIALYDTAERKTALEAFYQQWESEPLVLLKWLTLQAESNIPGNTSAVRALMQHPAFDIKNPNKVYSLVGGFSRSAVNFHAADGSGYALFGDIILELDKINPQVAARMVGPFTRYKKYDAARQGLMKAQLQRIVDAKPCDNVYEIVSKSLEG